MSRNILYLVLGALRVGVTVRGSMVWQHGQSGVEIRIDEIVVQIDGN